MPYIKQKDRDRVDTQNNPLTTGELNYKLCRMAVEALLRKGVSYQNLSEELERLDSIYMYPEEHIHLAPAMAILDISRAAHDAKLEFYRRVVAPYEDKKIKENGDVFMEVL